MILVLLISIIPIHFSYAVVSNTTGESARFTGSIASFFTPYDVFYVNGQPTYVSELTPEGQAW